MKISEITYQVVKNVKYLEDIGFTYEAFVNKEYDNDQDYTQSIVNAMAPINEAIHRLSDRNKIAFKVVSVGVPTNSLVDITQVSRVKKIKSMFYMEKSDYETVGFRECGKGYVFIERVFKKPLFMQFVEDIPPFKMSDIYEEYKDIDLSIIGINETMCDYIIEYAQGKLQEPIAPELANMHITRAEQYFDDLDEQQTVFSQKVVAKKFRI